MNAVKRITGRIYHDYLLPPQFEAYERILLAARENGYSFETISSFDEALSRENQGHGGYSMTLKGEPTKAVKGKYLVLRRDIDTSAIAVCRALLRLEEKCGARCTCFFRLSTLDKRFAMEVEQAGGESSYHYEEIASYALKHHIKRAEDVEQSLPAIRELFLKNLEGFRRATGLPCTAVASHGDFVNRKLGVANTEILLDPALRRRAGILREAYDEEHMRYTTCRIADQSSPDFVGEALAAIVRGEPVLYLLTHPRQWKADAAANTKENLIRVVNGLRYAL